MISLTKVGQFILKELLENTQTERIRHHKRLRKPVYKPVPLYP